MFTENMDRSQYKLSSRCRHGPDDFCQECYISPLKPPAKEVFVVKSGVYSDKTWHGIFSTREKAEELVTELILRRGGKGDPAQHTPDEWGKPHVEEWELDIPIPLEEGRYEVSISGDGTVQDWDFDQYASPTQAPVIWTNGYLGFGTTFELARRSAEELRRSDIALRGG